MASRSPRRRPALATATTRDRRPRARRHTERRSALATSQQPTWPFDLRIAHLMLIYPFSRGHDSLAMDRRRASKTQAPCRHHDSRLGDVSAAEIYRQQASKHLALVVGFRSGWRRSRNARRGSSLRLVVGRWPSRWRDETLVRNHKGGGCAAAKSTGHGRRSTRCAS